MTRLVWPNGTAEEPPRSDGYGPRPSIQTKEGPTRPFHVGTDHHSIGRICSIGDGTVIESSWIGWAGWQVLIYLGEIGGLRTWVRMCHFQGQSPLGRGDQVSLGQYVGLEGATGQVAGKHLHWEIYRGQVDRGSGGNPGTTIDPRPFIRAHLGGQTSEDEMIRIINTDKGDTLVVNHGDMSYWNVHEGIPAADVPKRVEWLKAQGMIEVQGLQPAAMLRGYSWVHAPENEAKAAKAAAEKSATGGVEVSTVVSEAVDQIAGKLKRALD